MAIESDADRAMLLEDFGTTVTVKSSGATFTALFDKAFVETLDIAGNRPVAVARTADLTANSVAVGTTLTIDETDYVVRVPEADGTGMTNLVLEEA